MRFLFTRRWLLFFVTVAVMAYGCLLLGEWQFHRLHDREQRNADTRANWKRPAVPVQQLLSLDEELAQPREWSKVTVVGTYDPDNTVVVRYQTRDGQTGVDVVTPVKLDDGSAVLVDRGWMATDDVADAIHDTPPPPSGRVTVTGYVRIDATGSSTAVSDRSVRSISSQAIGRTIDYPLLQGFVDASGQTPAAATELTPAELPDLSNGPHFFYGLQWWFFGILAVFGFGYFAYDERQRILADRARRANAPAGR